MAKPKTKGPGKGDFLKIDGSWWYVCMVWPAWDHLPLRALATPVTSPHYPERKDLGQPRVITVPPDAEVLSQGVLNNADEAVDPVRHNPRDGRK